MRHGSPIRKKNPGATNHAAVQKKRERIILPPVKSHRAEATEKRKDCKNYSTIPQVKKLSYFVSDL